MRPILSSVLAALLLLTVVVPASASHDVGASRIGGDDRYETAASVARVMTDQTDQVLLASGTEFADALSAPGFARLTGPILLTAPDSLPAATRQAMADLGVSVVTILGGPAAVSEDVADALRADGYEVRRIAGPNRYGTAAAVARQIVERSGMSTIEGQTTLFVASGQNFPDALALGPLAAASADNPFPILLTERDELPQETIDALEEFQVDRVIVAGGEAVVSEAVIEELDRRVDIVSRIAGADRQETAAELTNFGTRQFDSLNREAALLTRGHEFADALAAGPYGGAIGATILLAANPGELGATTQRKFADLCPSLNVVVAIGGTAAVNPSTLRAAVEAAQACEHGGAIGSIYTLSPTARQNVSSGATVSYTVTRQDGQPIARPLDIALFPCEAVNPYTDPPFFRDSSDQNDLADDSSETSEGFARITAVEGQTVTPRYYADRVDAGGDGRLTFEVFSAQPDCASVVVFHDRIENDQLNLDRNDQPVEDWTAGQVSWQ